MIAACRRPRRQLRPTLPLKRRSPAWGGWASLWRSGPLSTSSGNGDGATATSSDDASRLAARRFGAPTAINPAPVRPGLMTSLRSPTCQAQPMTELSALIDLRYRGVRHFKLVGCISGPRLDGDVYHHAVRHGSSWLYRLALVSEHWTHATPKNAPTGTRRTRWAHRTPGREPSANCA